MAAICMILARCQECESVCTGAIMRFRMQPERQRLLTCQSRPRCLSTRMYPDTI